eukprot:6204238-Pleurochrysis_carterae.AAC.3
MSERRKNPDQVALKEQNNDKLEALNQLLRDGKVGPHEVPRLYCLACMNARHIQVGGGGWQLFFPQAWLKDSPLLHKTLRSSTKSSVSSGAASWAPMIRKVSGALKHSLQAHVNAVCPGIQNFLPYANAFFLIACSLFALVYFPSLHAPFLAPSPTFFSAISVSPTMYRHRVRL